MDYEGGDFFRSSVRSKASSSLSDLGSREKIKDCCRKVIAFMCTQVGVGGLVVGYTVVGAFAFRYIERQNKAFQFNVHFEGCLNDIWKIAHQINTVNEPLFRTRMDTVLLEYQNKMVKLFREGFRGRTPEEIWSFPAALMFSLSIITMIGYGNMTPKTQWGKALTVIYAVFGIPLYILYFMNMGEVLAGCFKWVYTRLYECSSEDFEEEEKARRIVVPSRACLWVIGGYVLTGTVMFAIWERWNYLDSVYFCVTSLCKIGFGDLVPGANIQDSKGGSQTKLVINFMYMLVGLGLVAMCYNLMREEIRVKAKEFREDLTQCLEDTRTRFLYCFGRCGCRNF
ncbi:TWiK family of potassium channels protein 12 [Photinus pyralis]|uniref:Potassium channel domain-containing protein n=1 Tax=Photinus pyralis TaxID=7054 RepID=A0A1Y1N912_PHOPY|nr:TWiK family of potassium channels protein 12 [Photinus pyralis]